MSDIRARITSEQHRGIAEGRVHVRWTHWNLTITKGAVVINRDDCRDFESLLADAERRVIRYRDLAGRGMQLRSWDDLVAEASR